MEEPTFGDLLRDYLQARHRTNKEFYTRLNVHKSTLSKWINNIHKPAPEQLMGIIRFLNLSEAEIETLLKADGRKYSYKNLWIITPEDVAETKPEFSEQKIEYSGDLFPDEVTPTVSISEPPTRQPTLQNVVLHLSQAELDDLNNLRELRQMVKHIWIDGYLKDSLHSKSAIQLKLRDYSHLIDNRTWRIIPSQEEEDEPLALDASIVDAFDNKRQRLLILGEAGAGKSIMLLELTDALLKRSEETPGYPTPVVLLLGSWSKTKKSLAEWIADELNIHYGIPKKYGKKWIEQDKLLPLLDGLDEVQSIDRVSCMEAINHFRKDHFVPMAVCSRMEDYESISKELKLQGAVMLEPLTSHQINTYLNEAGTSLSAFQSALVYDAGLREFAKSPLMLDIMARVYKDAMQDDFIIVDTSRTRRQNLFDTYIQLMFGRRETKLIYSSAQTVRWLRWLANRLLKHNQPIFLIERMQPNWLAPASNEKSYWTLTMLLAMPVCGAILGLIGGIIRTLTSEQPSTMSSLLGLPLFGMFVGLSIALIDGISGKFRSIHPIEHSDTLFRRLKSSSYAALLWGLSGAFSGWLGSMLVSTLINHWTTTWPADILASVAWIASTDNPVDLQKYGMDNSFVFWMDIITYNVRNAGQFSARLSGSSTLNIELSNFINIGLNSGFTGRLSDVFFAGLTQMLFVPLSINHRLGDFLNYGIMLGIVGGVIGAFMEIELANEFGWSWKRIKHNLYCWVMTALGIGLLPGLIIGLAFGADSSQKSNPFLVIIILMLLNVLTFGLGGGILGMIVGGFIFQPSKKINTLPEKTHSPNHGIWLSAKYSLVTGLSGALLLGLAGWFLSEGTTLVNSLIFGLLFAPLFILIGRGDAVIKHCLMRLILFAKGYIPWNYARFLDYGTGLIFLRKVGGGYIFEHRAIMEHFASLDEQAIERITTTRQEQR